MTRHPNYKHWPSEKRDWYDKVSGNIEKHGHTILGTVDGHELSDPILEPYWETAEK